MTKDELQSAYERMCRRVDFYDHAVFEFVKFLEFNNDALTKAIAKTQCEYNDGVMDCIGAVEERFNKLFRTDIKPIRCPKTRITQFRLIKKDNEGD